MRIFRALCKWVGPSVLAAFLPLCSNQALGQDSNVVLTYHFVGATALAANANADSARRVFALRSTVNFETLVLDRLCAVVAQSFHFQYTKDTIGTLRPLFDTLLRTESIASAGGTPGSPLEFVLAVHLTPTQLRAWQTALRTVNHGPGGEMAALPFSGWQWDNGANDTFWMVPAKEWLVIGRGSKLRAARDGYLQQIQATGRPTTQLTDNCFEADVDWPRLASWAPLETCPFKLARTQIAIQPAFGGLHMTCQVNYPQNIDWQPQPRRLPTAMVREPLSSFATGVDVAPFLKSEDALAAFSTNPLRDQFYFWSMREMPFQSYVTWPESSPSNKMATLAVEATDALNPVLQRLNGTELTWQPKGNQLIWSKIPVIAPTLFAAPGTDGDFLVASLFPLTPGTTPAPTQLWDQFANRNNLVYYDWELTGSRVVEMLTVSQVIPVLQMLGIHGRQPGTPSANQAFALQKDWLLGLHSFLGNTVTEITKNSPASLTIVRNSPFVFSSLELVLLSHILSDTAAGPLDWSLLPQAKMTGPGVPRSH